MRSSPFILLLFSACGVGESSPASAAPAGRPAQGVHLSDSVLARTAADSTPAPAAQGIVRGLYVNRFAAQSARRMRSLVTIADSTEVNAFVIDIKDEFGLNYRSRDTVVAKNEGRAGAIVNLPALLDTLRAHRIMPIARIVVFKDSVAARVNPAHVIRRTDGTAWRDKKGLAWVNPYDRQVWEYNIRVAEEMARMGFAEIQFDYIRFPEPYRSLPQQVFPGAGDLSKPRALAAFFETACPRIHRYGARCTADIFGLVTTVPGALEVGQEWEMLSPYTDVLLPMVYPSHYPRGSFGIPHPNADPYRVIDIAISRARARDLKLGVTTPEHVRPWLQAFSLGQPKYGAHEIEEQKRAVYDAGYDGWVLWHPGSLYESFVPGLERTTASRKNPRLAARGSNP